MFRVKICGLTSIDDAQMVVDAGADAIGLNFYSGSPRCCTPKIASQIAAQMPSSVCKVGVFVNASAEEISRIASEVGLDLVQLHGDETPEQAQAVRPLPMLKAVGLDGDLAPAVSYLRKCYLLQSLPRMLLVDAVRSGQYGGTGKTLDWEFLREHRLQLGGMPLILAGGLKPDNVAQAIEIVRPWGVDVASGVESAPGKKSAEKVRTFVEAAMSAFSTLARS